MSVMLCVYKWSLLRLWNSSRLFYKLGYLQNKYTNTTTDELAAAYVPRHVEKCPLRDEFFVPPKISNERFTLILPPPNVTGTLHLGHALTATIQDVLVKWNQMCGKETVWVPGTDHAGIATQVIVEKKLWNETKKTRHEIGREKFVNEVWKWKHEKSDVIGEQLRRLGASLDWQREMFTMDEKQSQAVVEAFLYLHRQGLLYEADALVNWSCILRSAISDIEVDHVNVLGPTNLSVPGYVKPIEFGVLTKFAYKVVGTDEGEVVIATTRPETMLGDVAVAVHPGDERYYSYIGKQLWHPFRCEAIPIIGDEFVDPNFGTGAVKITPAHDPVDFEVSKRCSLPILHIITEDGKIKSNCKDFDGKKRFDVRTEVITALNDLQLYRGREDHAMVIPICSRSKDVIEFMIKPQWFVKCNDMARRAVQDVREGRLKIEPPQFEKIWFNWLENIRDWCISRQLWWGHRIPIYICNNKADGVIKVPARNKEEALQKAVEKFKCNDVTVQQVDDVLDTWFSSALLPFSAFGWPNKTQDFTTNYPLTLMETGHDIVFFWVARMVMLGSQLTGQLPFSRILLHGVVCDARGKKMSKSLGNVIAPEDVICGRTLKELEESSKCSLDAGVLTDEGFRNAVQGQRKMFPEGIPECGVDALRFTLCSHNIKNHYINFDVQECKTNKLFGNKLWQATKFTVKWCQAVSQSQTLREKLPCSLPEMDKWILSRLSRTVDVVNESLQNADFHNATTALKGFLYYDFCDVYLETTKRGLKRAESDEAASHCWVLVTCLDVGLRCLAPFMPHLSQHLHHQLLVHPAVKGAPIYFPRKFLEADTQMERNVETLLNVVTGIRRLKKIFNVSAKHRREVVLITRNEALNAHGYTIQDLAGCEEVTFCNNETDVTNTTEYIRDTISDDVILYLTVPEDLRKAFEVDKAKLNKKKTKLVVDLEKLQRMISANGYKVKVSSDAHENNLKKIVSLEEKIARIDYVSSLSGNRL